ncbi:MAG TPA: potassium-transporting ATPase subunit C, partial [Bryobacteraceae bacterium]|nr:potassium-transporting ATPase subunit C [Bryobacteraceae bacterium]
KFHQQNPGVTGLLPADLLTASGSGLDPDVSPASAAVQVARIAQVRGIAPEHIREVIAEHTIGRTLGFMGEPRVNVLEVNLDLDRLFPFKAAR